MSDYNNYEEEDFSSSKISGRTVWRILGTLKPYRKAVAGFILAVLTVSAIDSIATYLSKLIFDDAVAKNDQSALGGLIVIYAFVGLIQIGAIYLFIWICGVVGQKVEFDLRQKMFNHLQTLSFSYFDRTPLGWIMSRVNSDSEKIADLITWGMLDVVWGITNVVTALFFMTLINWQLTLVVALSLPIMYVVAMWFQKRILLEFRNSRKTNSTITGQYAENINGVRVVKALRREERNLTEFKVLTTNMYRASYKGAWLSALFMPTVQITSAFAVGAVVFWGGQAQQTGGISVGGIQAFISYIVFMMWPILDLSRVFAEMQHGVASAERIFSLIDTKPEIADVPNALAVKSIAGTIEFDHVEFYYKSDKPVLQDFTLTVREGESIALVGPTGAGKSTIVNLLCRFYEPKGGQIRINGTDYTTLTMQSIQSRIGMVLQTPRLFSGKIKENIRYGRLDATDEEVIDAAKLAGADSFISKFDHGYETEVGEGGVLLSVGQKQLISLARAVLAKPDIFIMDEATSSVDTLTEAVIQQGMETLMKRCTSFIIAHRLSTIKKADRIVVVDGGRIAEVGTHAELLRLRGQYYRLYTRQFREEKAVEYGLEKPEEAAEPVMALSR